jgi:hypothetical protein
LGLASIVVIDTVTIKRPCINIKTKKNGRRTREKKKTRGRHQSVENSGVAMVVE